MVDNNPKFKKRSKQEVYKDLEGKAADGGYSPDPVRTELLKQVLSQYPNIRDSMTEQSNALKNLANDMQVGNIAIAPIQGQDWRKKPTYLHNKESYDIDKLPKESNPDSFTSFLGRFDPFKTEVPLTLKDRQKDPIHWEPRSGDPQIFLPGLGLARDFRTGRSPEKLEDQDVNFHVSNSIDPRLLNSAFLGVNPKTLDEMIDAPGSGKIRFKLLQDKLAKEKKLKDLINSVRDEAEDDELK